MLIVVVVVVVVVLYYVQAGYVGLYFTTTYSSVDYQLTCNTRKVVCLRMEADPHGAPCGSEVD